MVSSITLGTFGTSNGKNVITGGQSGLDTKSLIDGLVAAKRMDTLRNPPGADPSKNVFNYRTASESTNTGASASNFVDVTVQPGAAIQSFTISNITSLAQQTKQQTDDFVLADSTTADAVTGAAGFFKAGTVNLRAVDGTVGGVGITLNSGDSLQSVVNKFNAVKDRTGIQASLLTVSTGSGTNTYKIIYSSTQTGTTYGFDLSKVSPAAGFGVVSDPSGVLSQVTSQPGFSTKQTATDATFDLDGVTVTRTSNAVSDVLSGVTFNLKQKTAGVIVTASVTPDTSIVQNAVQAFADAYNKFRLFASAQTQVGDDGLPTKDAVLARNHTFQDIIASVGTEVSSIVGGITAGHYSQLADVGVSLDDFTGDSTNPATKNILTVNTDKLLSALNSNFNQVRSVFEGQFSSDNSNLIVYHSDNRLTANNIQFNVNHTTKTYSATYVDVTGASQTVSLDGTDLGSGGVTLSGQAGTIFEGSKFIYAVAGDPPTISTTYTHGIADRLYNALNGALDATSGTVTSEISNITDQETRNKTEITKVDDYLVTYRDQLTQQYADLESALSKANGLLNLLDAQSKARSSSG